MRSGLDYGLEVLYRPCEIFRWNTDDSLAEGHAKVAMHASPLIWELSGGVQGGGGIQIFDGLLDIVGALSFEPPQICPAEYSPRPP